MPIVGPHTLLLLWAKKIESRYLDHQVNTSEGRRHFSFLVLLVLEGTYFFLFVLNDTVVILLVLSNSNIGLSAKVGYVMV